MKHMLLLALSLMSSAAFGHGFGWGTLVHTPQGMVEIQELKVGDSVVSCDVKKLRCEDRSVIGLHLFKADEAIYLSTNDDLLTVHGNQSFYNAEFKTWVDLKDLLMTHAIFQIETSDGVSENAMAFHSLHKKEYGFYTIEVEGNHNFYVGSKGILVHNFGPAMIPVISGSFNIGAPLAKAVITVAPIGLAIGAGILVGGMASETARKINVAMNRGDKLEVTEAREYKPTARHQEATQQNWASPANSPGQYEPINGQKGRLNKDTGEVWEKDQLHKDHWEIYRNKRDYENRSKGETRDRAAWEDGRLKVIK